jgi:hypothetical protein
MQHTLTPEPGLQIGVAVPRYEVEQRRESLISDAQHRFASPVRRRGEQLLEEEYDEATDTADTLMLRRRHSSSNIMGKATTAVFDGLLAGVNATSTVVAKTADTVRASVNDVRRGIRDAGMEMGSAVAKPVRDMARAVAGSRNSCSSPEPDDIVPTMFQSTLASLTPEEIEQLGTFPTLQWRLSLILVASNHSGCGCDG